MQKSEREEKTMKRQKLAFTKRITTLSTAFVFAVAGFAFLAPSGNVSAASPGFNIYNNCGSTQTFGYNYYDAAPGTGAYHQVGAGSTYRVNTSSTGIYRVELPKGVFNTFVYNGSNTTLPMC